METTRLKIAVLMCHAPIVIPEIGGARGAECRATTEAMGLCARRIIEAQPRTLVVLTPHAPRHASAFGCYDRKRLHGDFRNFGVYGLEKHFNVDGTACQELFRKASSANVSLESLGEVPLDHGAMVPLWFVSEAGFNGEVLVLGFPWNMTKELKGRIGKVIRETLEARGQPWALLASGDMSHRLQRGAPAGYHERACDFDAALVDLVKSKHYGESDSIASSLRELAAEDVVDSLDIAAAVLDGASENAEFFSYEGPFGVGYMEAVLHRVA